MITEDKSTEIFCMADDFCKFFDAMTAKYTLKPLNIHPRIVLVLSMSPTNLSPPTNILSVFENTIRLSADILIAPARTLIVFVSATNKAATKRKYTPLQSLFFCCHIVTSSHFEYNWLKIYGLSAWQQRDNAWQQTIRCHTRNLLFISAFTLRWQRDNKIQVFTGRSDNRSNNFYPLPSVVSHSIHFCSRRSLLPQCL